MKEIASFNPQYITQHKLHPHTLNVIAIAFTSTQWSLARSWFHFLVPLRKSETHFRSVNQERICIIDGTF